jgi:tRNA threonylcarbamoyladenosine biosynthesis protein TsaE
VAAPEDVSSPTFTLIHEYGREHGGGYVYHVDLYRLETPAEVGTLGLEEIFERDALVVIEWGERFRAIMPPDSIEIRLQALEGDRRHVAIPLLLKEL